MPRLIIGLEMAGHTFINDVIQYCQATGHAVDNERTLHIYNECLSQIFHCIDVDFQVFMANIMGIPNWKTIHFLEEPVDYERVAPFREAVRFMAILIWNRLKDKGNLDQQYVYLLESASSSVAIVSQVVNAENV